MTGIISAFMLLFVLVSIKAPWWTVAVMVGSILGDVVIAAYKVGRKERGDSE